MTSPADKWNALRFTARLDFLGQNGFSLQYAAREWSRLIDAIRERFGNDVSMA